MGGPEGLSNQDSLLNVTQLVILSYSIIPPHLYWIIPISTLAYCIFPHPKKLLLSPHSPVATATSIANLLNFSAPFHSKELYRIIFSISLLLFSRQLTPF